METSTQETPPHQTNSICHFRTAGDDLQMDSPLPQVLPFLSYKTPRPKGTCAQSPLLQRLQPFSCSASNTCFLFLPSHLPACPHTWLPDQGSQCVSSTRKPDTGTKHPPPDSRVGAQVPTARASFLLSFLPARTQPAPRSGKGRPDSGDAQGATLRPQFCLFNHIESTGEERSFWP